MNTSEDVSKLFNEVLQEISQNILQVMEELWITWSHLGVDNSKKIQNIKELVTIEKNFHHEITFESRQKLKNLEIEIEKLKDETEELSKHLSVNITILDLKDDMMLIEYKTQLEQQIIDYRKQLAQRRMKIDRLLEWQRDLSDKLGATIQELPEVPLPSEEELDKLKDHLEELQAERDKRAEIFLNTQIEIKDIMEKLQIRPETKFEHSVVTSLSVDFKVTDLNMDRLAKLQQDLQEKYEQTNNRVLELREHLSKLWDCLDEDQIYRENFLQAHPGCNPHTESAIKEEIKRCEQIKREKIQVFVANIRTKIKLMWDNVMYSNQEREKFIHCYRDIFTEDTLTLHELYLEKITKYYNENKHIFDLVLTRKNLWLKMLELEARASEPGRYQNRGGQLLREEKERKAIASKLPKIEVQIRELAGEYFVRTGEQFTVDGKPILQVLEDDWETRKTERQNKLSARKQALTPTTPLLRSLATSPLGERNRTAAGLPATAEKNRPASKRQLLTGSAPRAALAIANASALKRSAVTTVKRRISGRLVAKGITDKEGAKRKLDYEDLKKPPKLVVNGKVLHHKRKSSGKRRSSSRRSTDASHSTKSSHSDIEPVVQMDTLSESTMLTNYTDFKNRIHEKQISRSSLANSKGHDNVVSAGLCLTMDQNKTPKTTPKKTPRNKAAPDTPRIEKENVVHLNLHMTPNNNLYTPTRLTRSASKINKDGFATPRVPLSGNQMNMQRQNTATNLTVKTTPKIDIGRSKTHLHLPRVKNLPPLI